jgi:pSer/pThr/pTyr-binding forkhead associated (FHA) protein
MIACGRCGTQNSSDLYFCKSCGTRLVSTEPLSDEARQVSIADLRSVVHGLVSARRAESHPPPQQPQPAFRRGAAEEPPLLPVPREAGAAFRLVSINGDGSDGQVHSFGAGTVDIGRASAHLVFDDPFLASRHARIAATAEGHVLTALERRNGVYRRLRGPAELAPGDKILIGRQLLRFETLPDLERAAVASLENGQAIFGTRSRPSWGRLLQLTPAGVTRDVYHLGRSEVIVGREKTDLVFSDDELISTRHAKLSLRSGRVYLEDLSSLNGTFLSLREPYVLMSGDVVRMGNAVLRFES